MHKDHQAQGLRRLFSRPVNSHIISVLSPVESQAFTHFSTRLAQVLSRNGQRVLLVEDQTTPLNYRPLFRWDASRSLMQQLTEVDEHLLLLAPGCKAGEKTIVDAAKDLGDVIDILLFGGSRYSLHEAALETAAAQTLILLVDVGHVEAAYALVKGLRELQAPMEILLAGAGANRVAQAAQYFLKMPLSLAAATSKVWHMRDEAEQTSSNAISGCPGLPGYVARILNWNAPETHIIGSYAS